MSYQTLLNDVVIIAQNAGSAILDIYANEDFQVEVKDDHSPLTKADLASHNLIVEALDKLNVAPILSEEATVAWEQRSKWATYWLIDPLDGTKEFIKRNGEFTVNIALIKDGVAVLGVVHAPVKGTTYCGVSGEGAYKLTQEGGERESIKVSPAPGYDDCWRIVGSRSHSSDEFSSFVECFKRSEIVSMGSSLKLCLVAEGKADLYPRLGLTSEWDTAAAQAVVEAAGGKVLNWETMEPLQYNAKENILNPFFVVCAETSDVWLPKN